MLSEKPLGFRGAHRAYRVGTQRSPRIQGADEIGLTQKIEKGNISVNIEFLVAWFILAGLWCFFVLFVLSVSLSFLLVELFCCFLYVFKDIQGMMGCLID